MKGQKKKLRIPEGIVIKGFSYEFTKALLEKLKELVRENKITTKAEKILVKIMLSHLGSQLNRQLDELDKIPETIKLVEEFLAIFEEK